MGDIRTRFLDRLSGLEGAVAEEAANAIVRSLPGYHAAAAALHSGIREAVQRSFATLVDLWRESRSLTTDETAALVATGLPRSEFGIPLEETLHAHRIAAGVIWRYYTDVALTYDELDHGSVLGAAAIGYDYFNAVSAGITSRYVEAERERQEWRADAEHSLVEHLLATPPRLDAAARSAHVLGVRLTGSWQVLVIEPVGTRLARLEDLAGPVRRHLRSGSGTSLVAPVDRRMVVLRDVPPGEPARATEIAGARLGAGAVVAGASAIHRSYEAAMQALDIACRRDVPVVHIDDALLERFLLGVVSSADLVDGLLAPLRELPPTKREVAEASLEAYLDENCSITATSRRLHLQPQSFRYRLRRLHQWLPELRHPAGRLLLHVAIKRARLSPGPSEVAGAASGPPPPAKSVVPSAPAPQPSKSPDDHGNTQGRSRRGSGATPRG